jgi:hypothetical protein
MGPAVAVLVGAAAASVLALRWAFYFGGHDGSGLGLEMEKAGPLAKPAPAP